MNSDIPTPTTHDLPSSLIFRDLLVLEESLRQQYSTQSQLRHKYMFFMTSLIISAFTSAHLLYTGNDYFFPPFLLKLILSMCLVSLILFYISGEYNRTITYPRKFILSTNKGLRQFNLKLIRIHSSLSENFEELLLRITRKEKDLRPGGKDVKLVLHSRCFGMEVREAWEVYRQEYWEKENEYRRKKRSHGHTNSHSHSTHRHSNSKGRKGSVTDIEKKRKKKKRAGLQTT